MSVKSFISVATLAAVTGLAATSVLAQITIPTVPIGNPGNAPDPFTGNPLYGSVGYTYNIGRTEVTNAQYAAFLNAVAVTDTHSLYNTNMAFPGALGGITRTGSVGSYSYSTVSGRANNPVNWVSFWDATRFANWLHNGQPTGPQGNTTTENGAYALGGVTNPVNSSVSRNTGWQWAVTSEDEWYKAAYHQPASAGGDNDNYWLYPTSSNSINFSQANYSSVIGDTTPVGSYAANYYGTFDMGGNLWEWNEAIIVGSNHGVRGGSLGSNFLNLRSEDRSIFFLPTYEGLDAGFRVSQIPGPAPVALLTIGGLGALRRRR